MLDDIPLVEINYNISSPAVQTIKLIFDYTLALIVLFFFYPFIYFITKLSGKKTDFRKLYFKFHRYFPGKIVLLVLKNPLTVRE